MLMTLALALALLSAPTGPVPPLPVAAGAGARPVGAQMAIPAPPARGDGPWARVPLAHLARTTAVRWWAPVTPTRVVAHFDPPQRPWLPGHRGIDLAAAAGASVRAARAGRVTFAGTLAGRGVVAITHGELRTTYEPVAPTVVPGDWVDARDPIGVVATGTGHCGDGSCLHLGLRRSRTYLDPMLVLRGGSPRLRPW